jgi:hypothetical protein
MAIGMDKEWAEMSLWKRRVVILLTGICLLSAGCAPRPAPVTTVPANDLPAPDPDSDILKRARVWVDNQVPYGSFDDDTSNDYYDGYRADCSGFVSYAWGLPAPGATTKSLLSHPNAMEIDVSDLMPGDVLNNGVGGTKGHVVLFVRWKDRDHHVFIAYDENTTPGYASEKTFTLKQILSSGTWTIAELDPFAAGPYHAQRLISDVGPSTSSGKVSQPPVPGIYSINREIGGSAEWLVMLDSIEVLSDHKLRINYSWINLSNEPLYIHCDESIDVYVRLGDGTILEELDGGCQAEGEWQVPPDQKWSSTVLIDKLEDASAAFSLIYETVGQVDNLILEN